MLILESYRNGLLYQLCTFENDLIYEDYADVLSLNKDYILCVRKDELENNENDLYWEPFVVSVNELNVLDYIGINNNVSKKKQETCFYTFNLL